MIKNPQNEHESWCFPLCPEPPDWKLDWQDLVSCFEWVRQMAGVPQDPVYHGEGDLLIHTRMVLEALLSMQSWRNLGPQARSILFAVALLHDIAKPYATKTEQNGRISSRGHARRSEKITRQILWQGIDLQPAPFTLRELITSMVRYHGLPLYFPEREFNCPGYP